MTGGVLWDSSAILALLDADDADHGRAVEITHQLARENSPALITNYIEAEAHALLLRKLGRVLAREWLLGAGFPVIQIGSAEVQHAKELLARYADKDWTLCDATSFAFMDARRIRRAFSFDHHFRQYGRFEVLGSKG